MKKISLLDQKKHGLFPGIIKITQAAIRGVRMTIPAREALFAAGAVVIPDDEGTTYTVTLGESVPLGLVVVHTDIPAQYGFFEAISLRMDNEPAYPGEHDADYWHTLDFTPCPHCGAPLVWYEAGYVPGYRVCSAKPHHHWLAR